MRNYDEYGEIIQCIMHLFQGYYTQYFILFKATRYHKWQITAKFSNLMEVKTEKGKPGIMVLFHFSAYGLEPLHEGYLA